MSRIIERKTETIQIDMRCFRSVPEGIGGGCGGVMECDNQPTNLKPPYNHICSECGSLEKHDKRYPYIEHRII